MQGFSYFIPISLALQAHSLPLYPHIHRHLSLFQQALITPPLYGRWHSLTQRLLEKRDGNPISPDRNWVHQLNLDPRYRVPAGFGTKVIQKNQEDYMNAAWEQIGDVLEANRRMRLAQLAKEISWIWHTRDLQPLRAASLEKALTFTAPVHKRVISEGFTVYHQMDTSMVPTTIGSVAMRRIVRPRGRLIRSLPFEGDIQPDTLIERINNGEVSAAPPKQTPPGIVTVDDLSKTLLPTNAPPPIVDLLRRFPWLQYLPLVLALLLVILLWVLGLSEMIGIGGAAITALVAIYRQLQQWTKQIQQADSIREENQTPAAIDRLPKSPDFVLTEPGSSFKPSQGTTDSAEAIRFKDALKDTSKLIDVSRKAGALVPKVPLNLATVTDATIRAIDPEITIPRRMKSIIQLPDRLTDLLGDEFEEVMAYPEFDIPMYKPLSEISTELFLPNINLVEQNSITLLETNQKFIEAYMVGLNHEFARELLWREYPTDQRGSYFRQFWPANTFLNPDNLSKEQLRERSKDIPPIHTWRKDSQLDEHDNREQLGDKENELVLVIRGELLKKYPTAVIYAHKAQWQLKPDGTIDRTKTRIPVPLTSEEESNPSKNKKIKLPLFDPPAKVEPDITFVGFDLNAEEAKGRTGENPSDIEKPGWFFVIKERPGEPRFGLDIGTSSSISLWNDLAWENVLPEQPGGYIKIESIPLKDLKKLPGESQKDFDNKLEQHNQDKEVFWNPDTNSADLAYILYQVPVLIAIHASELLP